MFWFATERRSHCPPVAHLSYNVCLCPFLLWHLFQHTLSSENFMHATFSLIMNCEAQNMPITLHSKVGYSDFFCCGFWIALRIPLSSIPKWIYVVFSISCRIFLLLSIIQFRYVKFMEYPSMTFEADTNIKRRVFSDATLSFIGYFFWLYITASAGNLWSCWVSFKTSNTMGVFT